MNMPIRSVLLCGGIAVAALASLSAVRSEDPPTPAVKKPSSAFVIPDKVNAVLSGHCLACHNEKKQNGKVRLDTLATLGNAERLALLAKVQENVHLELMPPEGEKQPTRDERKLLSVWIRGVLEQSNAGELVDKLRYPDYGNAVEHAKLFSGEVRDKAFTPARRWLVSPQIFEERVLDIFKLDAKERDATRRRGLFGITNPFVLPDHSGVRYYDLSALDGGHLLIMLTNAEWISSKQIRAARVKKGEIKADVFENPKDSWYPKACPEAFEKVILNAGMPSVEELTAAIQTQFDCVLQRPATDKELARYLELTKASIEIGGNTEGLRQMLVSVLLESEFLYRLEFGAGKKDSHGRKMLSPREGSYAISYALGDRGPDAALAKAAREGRLNTKEDYKREVQRLLGDNQYYSGQIDKTLNGLHFQSNVTTHPKIVRFFREFFGYPGAMKVFKDATRSGGFYHAPDRGTTGTPGRLVLETDRIVTMYIEKDENVFQNLLTSNQFFVYHDKDNETGRKVIAEWREVYNTLKDTDWKKNPEKVFTDNYAFLKAHKSLKIEDDKFPGVIVHWMHYFEESFGQGRTPFTTPPWAHGYYLHHAPFYNLLPTPGTGRYGNWKSTIYTGDKNEKQEFWDYPTQQPFAIEQRMGILTHPSWLIAHSGNFQTDPIRRGRWIREKLLAGRVPDVPITVDAQVPEDPHKTFRERVEGVTGAASCWKCHQHMNPLGYAFEVYDDFGRFRTQESLENNENLVKKAQPKTGSLDVYKTKPVNAAGELGGTGDPQLDGKVNGALELIGKLAQSERVRQSIIRHAFRFYMGRNELLSDSQTLIDADKAYVESGGSFKAVIVSLLTSDSFMYRK